MDHSKSGYPPQYDHQQPHYDQQQVIHQQPQYGSPQPMGSTTTNTIIVNTPTNNPAMANGKPWSTGLMGCFEDCFSCAMGFFCPLIFACIVSAQMQENCCVPMVAGTIPMRLKTRMMLGIQGNICEDCCIVSFCGACALCQMSRELKNNGYN